MRGRLAALFSLTLILAMPSQADCPTPVQTPYNGVPRGGWAQGTSVYYDASQLPTLNRCSLELEAGSAVGAWTTANRSNNSAVTFSPMDSNHSATLVFQVAGPLYDPATGARVAANMQPTYDATGTLTAATINIDATNTVFFDPTRGNYCSAFYEVFQHEIGHTMGLANQPNDHDRSIMGPMCGVNDIGGCLSWGVTNCDNQGVNNVVTYGGSGSPAAASGGAVGSTGSDTSTECVSSTSTSYYEDTYADASGNSCTDTHEVDVTTDCYGDTIYSDVIVSAVCTSVTSSMCTDLGMTVVSDFDGECLYVFYCDQQYCEGVIFYEGCTLLEKDCDD